MYLFINYLEQQQIINNLAETSRNHEILLQLFSIMRLQFTFIDKNVQLHVGMFNLLELPYLRIKSFIDEIVNSAVNFYLNLLDTRMDLLFL